MIPYVIAFVAWVSVVPYLHAAEREGPRICNGMLHDQGPTLDQLRRKFLGPDAPPAAMAETSGLAFEGAEFVLISPDGPFRLRLPGYPGHLFAWGSANDALIPTIAAYLEPFRARGSVIAPARKLEGVFTQVGSGSSLFSIDQIDLTDFTGDLSQTR